MVCISAVHAQQITLHNPEVVSVTLDRISPPLSSFPEDPPTMEELNGPRVERENPSMENHTGFDNANALPKGADPARQIDYSDGTLRGTSATVLSNWAGLTAAVDPSDNTIAIGPSHVFQMTNNSQSTYIRIWNKSGTILVNNKKVSVITGVTNDCGDPNVIYDQVADRYVMLVLNSCSFSNKKLLLCVTQTNDPTGSWYVYSIKFSNGFPDYPKLALWGNSYIVTTNSNAPSVWALNRSQMLAGLTSTALKFTMTAFGTIGFQAPSPVSQTGSIAPPANEPATIVRAADDGWSGVANDHLELFKLTIDWTNTNNSTMTGPTNLTTISYNSKLCSYTSFSCIPQKNSTKKLDPLSNIVMDKAQYRNFSDHESIVLTHTCNADGNGTAGVRWYELRTDVNGAWFIYQQSTYQPDLTHRWMSSITINGDGSIALGYNTSSSTTFPSQRFTGRASVDAINSMIVTENMPITGTAANGSTRYGDYNGMMTDPSDNSFWLTTNYNASSSWSTSVCHFTITHTLQKNAPSNIVVNHVTKSSVELSWTGQETPQYEVRYREEGTVPWNIAGKTALAGFVVTGLNADTKYEFSLGGEADGDVLYSEIVSATTLREDAQAENTVASNSEIKIAPLPASDNVQITFTVAAASSTQIQIYSLNGQLLLTQPLYALEGINITNTDVHSLKNGTYIVKVITNESVATNKMMIQR